MADLKVQNLPEIFKPEDSTWASRAASRGEIRRIARGIYTSNLDEPLEQLVRRRWFDLAALVFPGATVVDRSAHDGGPAEDGSLFLDVGPKPSSPRTVNLPGLQLRPRNGPGPVEGDTEFVAIHMASPARAALDNLWPSRARAGVARTLRTDELESWLDRLARSQGEEALNRLRDQARKIYPKLDAAEQFETLDQTIGAMLGTRETGLETRAAQARQAGVAYDTERLRLFEELRTELSKQHLPERAAPDDRLRLFAFYEAYFSNWIEGTEFEVEEAEQIVFEGRVPEQRPADAHDVRGTFEAASSAPFRARPPEDYEALVAYLSGSHELVMGGRPEASPGRFKERSNRVGAVTFVRPELVEGTLREGFKLHQTLISGLARAVFMLFLISEVHPFADGNGRVSRLLMNAGLSADSLCRIVIPPVYRDEYLSALRALSVNANPTPVWKVLDRAQRWAAEIEWSDRASTLRAIEASNALATPEEARDRNLHLIDP